MSGPQSPRRKYATKWNQPLQQEAARQRKDGDRKKIPVIIRFKRPVTLNRLKRLRRHAAGHSFGIGLRLPLLRSVCSRVSAEALKTICECDVVHRVYLDGIKRASLNIAAPSIGAAAVRRRIGLTGQGVGIAVLDTGVYPHPDLIRPMNRIIGFKDFINGRSRPYDDNGHGTHIAGDAAGNGWSSSGRYSGAAPGAGIVGVKVLDREGNGYDSVIIKGIEWCVANRKRLNLRILSLSLGETASVSWREDPVCLALEQAVRAGLVVVVAAGNSGPSGGTIESPGISPSAITVGAVDDRRTVWQGDDRVSWFSSRGPVRGVPGKPDVTAPGESVISLRSPGSALDRELPWDRVGKSYFVLSGTSVSAPLVAGAAALLLQQRPCLSPAQIKSALKQRAFDLRVKPMSAGRGEVNLRFLAAGGRRKRR